MHDLGGGVVSYPDSAITVYDPAIKESDPRFGTEGSLSLFDPVFSTQLAWQNLDQYVNNILLGGGTNVLTGNLGSFNSQIAKTTASGTQFALAQIDNYTQTNQPFNNFPSYWNTAIQAQVTHPFLQNGGVMFNRIAGPNATPGLYFQNGIMLARVDTDIAIADFEQGVNRAGQQCRKRILGALFRLSRSRRQEGRAQKHARNLRKVKRLLVAGGTGGTEGNEAQAAAQYYRMRSEVENALSGRAGVESCAGAGTLGGSFFGVGGVYAREANLRLLMGLPNNDGRLIRPHDEPILARVQFDWTDALTDALARRVELRRSRWQIQRAELEVIANRNFLLPQLNGQATYRWQGFGNQLLSQANNVPEFNNATQNLLSGKFQQYQLGLNFDMPIGFRRGHAAVRRPNSNWLAPRGARGRGARSRTTWEWRVRESRGPIP